MELHRLTIAEAHEGLKKKKFSSEELTLSCLKQIEKTEPSVHSFITVMGDAALATAKAVDKTKDFSSPMSGIPLAIKDNMSVMGTKTTAGSKILENFTAAYDATVISRLKKAGAVMVGKTNMDEFACGSSCETSYFGPTKNPWDTKRVPGGSSGGSAAAVAADQVIASLGSDTGGSIRQPASLSGVVGIKPTYGKVSRYGLLAMASSLDQIGPFAKTVRDAALLQGAIEGSDPKDSTTADLPPQDYTPFLERDLRGLRVGVPREYFDVSKGGMEGLDPQVQKEVQKSIDHLRALGAEIDDTISLPHSKYALAVYYILMPAELSSNLERFDGMRFGLSVRDKKTLLDTYVDSRGQGFGAEIRRRIMLGTYALSAGYYDAYYKKAQQVRTLVVQDFTEAFKRVHVIVTPTSPTVAFPLGAKTSDPLSMYLSDIYTVSANIAGVPGVSLPCGLATPADGKHALPVGLQIIGKHFDEGTVFQVAHNLEQALNFKRLKL